MDVFIEMVFADQKLFMCPPLRSVERQAQDDRNVMSKSCMCLCSAAKLEVIIERRAIMKATKTAVMLLCAMLAGSALADDRHHPPEKGGGAMPIEQMKQNLHSMESQIERIANAKSDAERRAAMAEHMATMRAQMEMMSGGGMMDACPMGGPGIAGDMGQRMHQMEQRMDMMQMMMQGMVGTPSGRMPMQPGKN